jgi:TPP-dependent pyruvate/acetoin dehydrogenase alpha subunit
MYDPELYRSKEEVEEWRRHCPIEALQKRLQDEGILIDKRKTEMETSVTEEIEKAVAFAEAGPWEPVEDLLKDVLTVAWEKNKNAKS